ncbi:MAG: hypothetical protein C4B56_06490 [Candidatus Methanophagaceae archaeon]|nr:MAG: hypothetical protein C4B56_06490 [Methanophagales archaeon]
MSNKLESLGNAIMDKRTLIAIIVIAILWRAGISSDDKIALWESECSGIALFVMGWALFAYIFYMSRGLKGWLELNKIYRWIAVSLAAINVYVIVYYAMRWYRLAGVGGVSESLVPYDFLFRDIRYLLLVVFYCVVIWLAKYLKKVYGDYTLLFKEPSKV